MAAITGNPKPFSPLGLGCYIYNNDLWSTECERILIDTMETALESGINHFDTATGYGDGASEKLVGRFIKTCRERVFLATKAGISSTNPRDMLESVQRSLERLDTEAIDLYYIHWPRSDMDIRPAMAGLELARAQELVRAVGVSNFSAAQMEMVSQVGQVDANQIPHNLFWRYSERGAIPYCRAHGIGVVTYGSIGFGILTGKFKRVLALDPADDRNRNMLFQEPIWGGIYSAVEQMKTVAAEVGRPLLHLAIRWSLAQPGAACVLVGANTPAQARENAAALQGDIPDWALARLSAISAEAMSSIPAEANPYRYNP